MYIRNRFRSQFRSILLYMNVYGDSSLYPLSFLIRIFDLFRIFKRKIMLSFVDISNRAFDILSAAMRWVVVTSLVAHYENDQSTMLEILSEIYATEKCICIR